MGGIINGALGNTNNFSAQSSPVQSDFSRYTPTSGVNALGINAIPKDTFNPQAAQQQNPFDAGTAQGQQGQLQSTVGQQQSFINALGNQGGVGNQASVFGQQQALANQLSQQAQGGGPNPALAQLSQSTSNNIKNQAALMAGQRGAGHNVGAMAKQAAEQGIAAQQQAGGQAAVMRAQQQLAAQQALQGQQASMANLATQQVGQQAQGINALGNLQLGMQGQTLGALAAQNQNATAQQESINQIRANQAMQSQSLAAQNIAQQNQMNFGVQQQNNALNSGQNQQLNQIKASNAQATAGNNLAAQGVNAQISSQNAAQNAAVTGGILQGVGSALAHGGIIKGYAGGGDVMSTDFTPRPLYTPPAALPAISDPSGPQSSFGKKSANGQPINPYQTFGAGIGRSIKSHMTGGTWFPTDNDSNNSSILDAPPALIHDENFGTGTGGSAGTGIMAENKAKGGNVGEKLKTGGKVPGKAKHPGDTLKNDTVAAKLSPGEIVIPRSITQGKDAPKKAAEFVASVLARGGR